MYAEPGNQAAKDWLADCFEQVGYHKESSSLRNSFLAAARELRSGIPAGLTVDTASPDTIRGMPTDRWLDDRAILLDSDMAGDTAFVINLVTPDTGEKFVVELSNATLTTITGFLAPEVDLTVTIDRADLEPVMMRKATSATQAAAGRARCEGNAQVLEQLMGSLAPFPPDFEIMPGTRPAATPK